MSQWLKGIIGQQALVDIADNIQREDSALIIKCAGFNFLLGFECVSEVIEYQNIVPYPREHELHIGVLNMRGEIVPVISLLASFGQKHPDEAVLKKDKRIIIVRRHSGTFALAADLVKKVSVPEGTLAQHTNVEVEGTVYRILDEEFFEGLEHKIGESAA
jgi:chemotaxis signal transduction protein